jgi:hypothetical protein
VTVGDDYTYEDQGTVNAVGGHFTPISGEATCGCIPLDIEGNKKTDAPLVPVGFSVTDFYTGPLPGDKPHGTSVREPGGKPVAAIVEPAVRERPVTPEPPPVHEPSGVREPAKPPELEKPSPQAETAEVKPGEPAPAEAGKTKGKPAASIGEVVAEAPGPQGRVKVTKTGEIYSCHNPCDILADKYAEVFKRDEGFRSQLELLRKRAAAAKGDAARAEKVARDAEALEERILSKYPEYDPAVQKREAEAAERRKAIAEKASQQTAPAKPHVETVEEYIARGGNIQHLAEVLHDHHLLPQEFRDKFAAAGIDIDQPKYLVPLSPQQHLGEVHKGARGGEWNAAWADFFQQHPTITPALQPAIQAKLAQLRASFRI